MNKKNNKSVSVKTMILTRESNIDNQQSMVERLNKNNFTDYEFFICPDDTGEGYTNLDHINCISKALSVDTVKNVMVLHDDVVLSNKIGNIDVTLSLVKDFDILYLGFTPLYVNGMQYQYFKMPIFYDTQIKKLNYGAKDLFAYVVSRDGFENSISNILKTTTENSSNALLEAQRFNNSYCLIPFYAVNDSFFYGTSYSFLNKYVKFTGKWSIEEKK